MSLSITRRLAFLSTITSCLILSLSTGFLYWNLKDNLERKDIKLLIEEMAELDSLLMENPSNWKEMREDFLTEEVINSRLTKYYKRILNENKSVLIASTGMEKIIPMNVFPASNKGIDYSDRGKKWRSKDGKIFFLMTVVTEIRRPEKKKYILQSAIDITQDENLINDYRYKIIFVLFFGIFLSCGMNIWVVKSSMRPLKDITEKVRQVTASKLHERVHPEHWPKELNALATAFDEMLNRLEDSFTRLSQFSVNLAHELRTPINNLMGEAQVAISKARTPQEYQQVLESSLEEYARLSRMIDNLFFLARSENKEIKLERQAINVRREIDKIVEFYDAVAQEKEIKVSCQGEGSLNVDLTLFQRLINNLLSNSLQYTPKGGAVTVIIDRSSENALCISVKDTGIGIDQKDLPHILNRFFRSQSARETYPQGMGIGLYIVNSIMNLHGGSVKIQSVLGQGTTVTVIFLI